jgi:heme/copper-type cytochrome/quinol oxidase subunit 4
MFFIAFMITELIIKWEFNDWSIPVGFTFLIMLAIRGFAMVLKHKSEQNRCILTCTVIFFVIGSIFCQLFVYISMHKVTLSQRKLIHDGIVVSAIVVELLVVDTILYPIYAAASSMLCDSVTKKMPELLI